MTHEPDCTCGANPEGTRYYSSVRRDDGNTLALSGPYLTHQAALDAVPNDKAWVHEVDPIHAPWLAYGTFAAKPGVEVTVVKR